ncbi:hypothetical protein PsorP6_011281 [Peronosclerospora sorghi]|uniref:Uncharacterized protein n=1 Tax=Peronosclerospora sorghi TaxID=230839 RepID=A0ACC0WLU1_9STRA|nr:hypothetical protein PsorP6_011281 [Peronosclerospora sorghi]
MNETNILVKRVTHTNNRDPVHLILPDIVALLPSSLTSFLPPDDALNLLDHCISSLPQDVRDIVATQGLKNFSEWEGKIHLGKQCVRDWYRLKPFKALVGPLDRCECRQSHSPVLTESLFPRLFNARYHLLQAMCLVYKGIWPHCYRVLQVDRNFERRQYGVFQPIVFSLSTVQEQFICTEKDGQRLKSINTKDVAELTRLLNALEKDFGTRFFHSTSSSPMPAGMVEAHWKSIDVHVETDTTFCHFCDAKTDSMVEGPLNPQFREAEYEFLMRQHCRDVYQPLKRFMTRHLEHVRYVRPPLGWNQDENQFQGNKWFDLIAGFTPGGVLCGVYLTDVRIPRAYITHHLAPGAYPFDEGAINFTHLRIARPRGNEQLQLSDSQRDKSLLRLVCCEDGCPSAPSPSYSEQKSQYDHSDPKNWYRAMLAKEPYKNLAGLKRFTDR